MKNSVIAIGLVVAVGFAKSKMGGMSKSNAFENLPRNQYLAVWKIAELTGLSEYQVVQALRKLKKQGKVWENAGMYLFR